MQRTKEKVDTRTNSRKKSQETDRQQDAAELNNGANKPPHTVVQNGNDKGTEMAQSREGEGKR
jgi:hypothetical protein